MKELIVVVEGGKEQRIKAAKFVVVNEELHLHDTRGEMIACFAHQGWLSVRWADNTPPTPQEMET